MKLVHISGSTKGEKLTDGSLIHIYLGTKPPTEADIDDPEAAGWVQLTDDWVTTTTLDTGSGFLETASAAIPPYKGKPVHWDKWLLIPNEYNYFKIMSTCPECQKINSPQSTYRDMIMTGSFLNDPNL